MSTVLTRVLIATSISLLISTFVYSFMGPRNLDREVIIIISVLALFFAIPMILGYIVSYLLITYQNLALSTINIILFVVNGFLLIGTSILTFGVAIQFPWIMVGFCYILIGIYVFIETIKNFGKKPENNKNGFVDEDLLDDGF